MWLSIKASRATFANERLSPASSTSYISPTACVDLVSSLGAWALEMSSGVVFFPLLTLLMADKRDSILCNLILRDMIILSLDSRASFRNSFSLCAMRDDLLCFARSLMTALSNSISACESCSFFCLNVSFSISFSAEASERRASNS